MAEKETKDDQARLEDLEPKEETAEDVKGGQGTEEPDTQFTGFGRFATKKP